MVNIEENVSQICYRMTLNARSRLANPNCFAFRSSVSTTGTLKSQRAIKAAIPTAPMNNHNANELKPTDAELAKKISAETESLLSQERDCNV